MTDVFTLHKGDSPLLVSVPHDGRRIPGAQRQRMTEKGLDLPDTDWHVAQLYDFVRATGGSMIVARMSRYVVDLNRPPGNEDLYEGQVATGLCPQQTFLGEPLYVGDSPVPEDEQTERVERYRRPYHEQLANCLDSLRARHGYALLWDAHSIASRVPSLFDGELPEFNFGTYDGRSCARGIARELLGAMRASDYDVVSNGRFKGGYITRHYGAPSANVHAVQLELAQRTYMDEGSREYDAARAEKLRSTLRTLLETFVSAAAIQ